MAEETQANTDAWTPSRRAELVLSILKGETTEADAARSNALTLEEIEDWKRLFLLGAEEALGGRRNAQRRLLSRLPNGCVVGSIVVLAILLRGGFFVGLVSGEPQDDGIYYGHAFALYNEGPRYLERFRNLPLNFVANPIDQFDVRPLVTYPIAASFALFGPGELSATLWGFLCSTLSVLVAYRLGFVLHGRTVGLIAALLCAFYPLEVVNGTRILSDVQVGLFASIGLLLLAEAMRRRSPVLYALSGAAAAGAYLANGRGLIFFVALLVSGVLLCVFRKASWRVPASIALGFLAIFTLEAIIYYQSTGDPLLSYHIQRGASRYKYLHETVSSLQWGFLQVRYTNGQPLELIRSVLLLNDGPINQFGLFFFLFLVSALFSLARGRNRLLVAMAAGLFVYFEFGPVWVSVDWPRRGVEYMMVFKQERFLLMLTAPVVVVSAYFLSAIGRMSPVASAVIILVLFVTSLSAITRTRDHYRAGLSELRTISGHVRSNPDQVFFGDLWAVLHVNIFTRYQAQNLKVIDLRTTLDEVRHACVMLGGSRGVELMADYVEATLPVFAREVLDTGVTPPGWKLSREIKGEHNAQRRQDFKVYCVP